MMPAKPIQIFIPDAGPLISLATADELDLLLRVAVDVRLIITDHGIWEVTRRDDLPDTHRIKAFLEANAKRVEVMETSVGAMARNTMQSADGKETIRRMKNLGELSISSAMIDMRYRAPGLATFVLIEAEWFGSHASREGNAHLISTSAWLDGLEQIGVISSASNVRRKIHEGRSNFRVKYRVDDPAPNPKMEGGPSGGPSSNPACETVPHRRVAEQHVNKPKTPSKAKAQLVPELCFQKGNVE